MDHVELSIWSYSLEVDSIIFLVTDFTIILSEKLRRLF